MLTWAGDFSAVAEFVHKYCAAPVGIPLRVFGVMGGIWPIPPPPPARPILAHPPDPTSPFPPYATIPHTTTDTLH